MIKIIQMVEDFGLGGRERVVETIYDGLNKKKYHVEIWCLVGGDKLANKFIEEKKSIKILGLKSYYNPFNIIKLAKLLKVNKVDIIHAHSYFASTFGRIAGMLAGVPILVTHVHTTHWELSMRNRLIERLLSYFTDKIICCSNNVRNFVILYERIRANKVITIHNGASCRVRFNTYFQDDKNINITIVASLLKNKGHQYLLDAFSIIVAENKKVILNIVGDGHLKSHLMEYAQTVGITKYVKFWGEVDDPIPIIQKSDICVLPSIEREGLGLSIIEAMCLSKPVIGSNIGGITELIEDNVTGFLVPPMDSKYLAEKLKILIQDKEKRVNMGKNGRRRFEKHFEAQVMVKKIESLYQKLIENKFDFCH